jgi:hypothetical protein
MAKTKVKKPVVKAASKPAKKKVSKPVAKKAAPKSVAKPAAKPTSKAAVKPSKAPIKKKASKVAAPPPKAKKALPPPAKKVEAKKAVAAPQKKAVAPVKEKELKKAAPAKEAKGAKKPAKAKKEEGELEDEFIADDDLGHDEIGEYEEELKAVESLDDESEDVAEWTPEVNDTGEEEIFLTDAEGRRYCRARDCDQAAIVDAYCRYHYLLLWKKIQVRKKILVDGKLEKYIEELTARYPDKFLEMIRRDLRTEKDFLAAIAELEIDESAEGEFEEDTQYIEEVRGMGEGSSSGVEDEEF